MISTPSPARTPPAFGPHGALVAEFLRDLGRFSVDWPALATWLDQHAAESADALARLADADDDIPAGRLIAVDDAALAAFHALDLRPGEFADPMGRVTIQSRVVAAAQAIATPEVFSPEERRSLLQPFADAGVSGAARALRTR
ncbi:hypothetical protein [Cellulomonas denverensis]|uniref:Uncharacterized protein n=1 Tax=Cellulomonas denverensis TaxID=264297 RepID=A0A7X6R0R8_9CELL|nr:hypothetical protein [Cellulomonas denverensis]NKY24609.1 hypothetical protein [Cellulomonas denverensis]GIG25699.1 hypothetical protein Cde04nite_19430 [Cellulomonas denverensis]